MDLQIQLVRLQQANLLYKPKCLLNQKLTSL